MAGVRWPEADWALGFLQPVTKGAFGARGLACTRSVSPSELPPHATAHREPGGRRGAGAARLQEDEDLRFLRPYFAKVQAVDANMFDLSVTMVHPATAAEAFRPHYDITLSDHILTRASVGGLTVRRAAVLCGCRPSVRPWVVTRLIDANHTMRRDPGPAPRVSSLVARPARTCGCAAGLPFDTSISAGDSAALAKCCVAREAHARLVGWPCLAGG